MSVIILGDEAKGNIVLTHSLHVLTTKKINEISR